MDQSLATQYDKFAKAFSDNHNLGDHGNKFNREVFYVHMEFVKPGARLLDLGCGDGTDLVYYQEKLQAEVYGLDASEELLKIAATSLPNAKLERGFFEHTPYQNGFFDVVVSKYAIMTSKDVQPVFQEIHRVLKPGGIMLYLVTHPFRQYFEKKDPQADYFSQEVVDSHILNDTVVVQEPTHVLTEFLSSFLFKNFDVLAYDEQFDPAAEQIGGMRYPGFLIIKAKKR